MKLIDLGYFWYFSQLDFSYSLRKFHRVFKQWIETAIAREHRSVAKKCFSIGWEFCLLVARLAKQLRHDC